MVTANPCVNPKDFDDATRQALLTACAWHHQHPHATPAVPATSWALGNAINALEQPGWSPLDGASTVALAVATIAYIEASAYKHNSAGTLRSDRDSLEAARGLQPIRPDSTTAAYVNRVYPQLLESALAHLADEDLRAAVRDGI